MTEPPVQEGLSRWDYLLRTWQELDVPDGWRAEILDDNGVVLVAPPSIPHNLIADLVHWSLMEAIPRERGWGLYQTLGIQVTTSGQVFMPDLVVIPRSALRGKTKPPCPAEKAFLAVEIVSPSSRNNDRTIKLRGYARAGVPLYLLIDAFNEVGPSVTLYEQPANGQYDRTTSVRFGDKIRLPDPFDTEIDTDEFPGLDEW